VQDKKKTNENETGVKNVYYLISLIAKIDQDIFISKRSKNTIC